MFTDASKPLIFTDVSKHLIFTDVSKPLKFTDASPSTFMGLNPSKDIGIYSETQRQFSRACLIA
jgi:hypothetical protein